MLSKNAHSLTSTLTDSFYKERGLSALHKIFVRKATVLKYRDRLKKKKKASVGQTWKLSDMCTVFGLTNMHTMFGYMAETIVIIKGNKCLASVTG